MNKTAFKNDGVESCLFPGHLKRVNVHCRGLCLSCYNAAAKMVERKKTTWDELEKAGKVRISPRRRYEVRMKWFLNGKSAKDKP